MSCICETSGIVCGKCGAGWKRENRLTQAERDVIEAAMEHYPEGLICVDGPRSLSRLISAIQTIRAERAPKPRYHVELAIRDHCTPWAVVWDGVRTESRWPTQVNAQYRADILNAAEAKK